MSYTSISIFTFEKQKLQQVLNNLPIDKESSTYLGIPDLTIVKRTNDGSRSIYLTINVFGKHIWSEYVFQSDDASQEVPDSVLNRAMAVIERYREFMHKIDYKTLERTYISEQ